MSAPFDRSPDIQLDESVIERMVETFSALSDPGRIRIIASLQDSETHVGALAEMVGLSESAVSHHLRHLRHLRIVKARKDGRQVFYSLADEHIVDLFQRSLEHVLHD